MIRRTVQQASLATLSGLLPHYVSFYFFRTPLWTETIAESIMARTPSNWAVPLLAVMGAWAKPFAVTGGLAALGFSVWLICLSAQRWLAVLAGCALAAVALGYGFDYWSWLGDLSFWLPVALVVAIGWQPERVVLPERRALLTAVMSSGTVAVAVESYLRDRRLAVKAAKPQPLDPFQAPDRSAFAPGLVRKAITPVDEFYVMSKNTVDPQLDPHTWRLQVTHDGRVLREFRYDELLALPRKEQYVTLRCVSNNLVSDLMGTACWSGVRLRQLLDLRSLSPAVVEVAVIGADGHGDSVAPSYAFSDEALFALGMNGLTLNRNHGYPLRALMPRYYGFRSVKWIREIRLCDRPYYGTWQRRGFTKDPIVQVASHIDRIRETQDGIVVGGASFTGTRGVRQVQVRVDQGPWVNAILEPPLSPYTLTRWWAKLPATRGKMIEARALAGDGRWQEAQESPLYPEGVKGPTRRRMPS